MKRSRTEPFGQFSEPGSHEAQILSIIEDGSCIYDDPERSRSCLRGLESLLRDRVLCDVTIAVDNKEFLCHRLILAASSPYFRAMFQHEFVEQSSQKITLNQVGADSFDAILHYLYNGRVKLNAANVQGVFLAAHMFQIPSLECICASYMEVKITPQNCIEVYFFAFLYEQEKLLLAARNVIGENFLQIVRSEEFLNLPAGQASEILSLTIARAKEEEVYSAAVAWIKQGKKKQADIYTVMKSVRFALLDERVFRQRVKNNLLFKDCPQLQGIFEQMLYFLNHPNRWHEVDLPLEPRVGCSTTDRNIRSITYSSHQYLNHYLPEPEVAHALNQDRFKILPNDVAEQPALSSKGLHDLYVVGGSNINRMKVSKKAYEYTLTCFIEPFGKLSSMSSGRTQFSLVQVDRFLYAVGGCQKNQNLDTVEKFDADKNQWMRVASLPFKLRCMTATSYQGKLYVFGGEVQQKRKGRQERGLSNRALCYNPETDKWKMLYPMKTSRAASACGIFGNKIYVAGGFSSIGGNWVKKSIPDAILSSCEMYDPMTDTWSEGPDLPMSLYSLGMAKYQGTLFVLGGISAVKGSDTESYSQRVFRLNASGTEWVEVKTKLSRPPQKFASFASLTFEYNRSLFETKPFNSFMDSDSEESEPSPWHSRTPHRDLSQIHLNSSTDSLSSVTDSEALGLY